MIYAKGAENIALTRKGKLVAPDREWQLMKYAMGAIKDDLQ